MLRRQGIQTQIVLILIVALVLLAAGLQIVHVLRERDALEEANRRQSLAIANSLNESTRAFGSFLSLPVMDEINPDTGEVFQYMTFMLKEFEQGFTRYIASQPNIAFETLVMSNGTILVHSNPELANASVESLNLANLPLDKTVRRKAPGYGDVYLTRVPLDPMEWMPTFRLDFVMGMYAKPVDDEIENSILSSLLVALGAVAGVSLIGGYLVRRNVARPIRAVQMAAQTFGEGNLDYRIKPQGSPEVHNLAVTLNQMAENVKQSREVVEALFHNMEQRVHEHTRDLETSAEIGRITTSLRSLDMLLRETVEQIRQRYDVIYHTQIFLLDDMREYAVLVESTGQAGQELIKLGHRLAVGSNSVIGRTTARGQTVIVSDTRTGIVPWQPNPLLPDTRSEMALPLAIEGRVIGALDVQSIYPDAFTSEMVQVLEVLADQIAIAIENARLLNESNRRVQEIDALNRQLTRTTWEEFIAEEKARSPLGYYYDRMRTALLDDGVLDHLGDYKSETKIRVRNETIGTLIATLPDNRELSDDDQDLIEAVAERVALAVENARLFQQTQRALSETARLYEAARAVNSMSDLMAVFQLVGEELATVPHVHHIEVLLSGPDPVLVQYLENTFTWSRSDTRSRSVTGERVPVMSLDQDKAGELPDNAPEVVVTDELTRDHPFYAKLHQIQAGSALMVPLNVGGRWFGMLLCCSTRMSGFDPSYITFASALADQLALAIENRRLFEEAQIEARRARALAEAGQLASQIGGDYETGLQSLFQTVAGPGQYNRWWFGLLTEDRTALRCVAASRPDAVQTIVLEQENNALAEAARIGEMVLVNDPNDHPVIGTYPPDILEDWGKHIAMPVKIGAALVGVLQIGRSLDEPNLDERDIQLVATLASQVAVATENRQLFAQAESQRQYLQTIVDTMPTGVLVVDNTNQIMLSNESLRNLLGPDMRPDTPTSPQTYPIIQSDTNEPYPGDAWPLTRVFQTGELVMLDDMIAIKPDGSQINMMAQAAPIRDHTGAITSVVAAFQDITDLHELERALQDSLRETTLLYEASRSISRSTRLDDLLQVLVWQLSTLMPDRAFIFLKDEEDEDPRLATSWPPDASPVEYDDACFSSWFSTEPVVLQEDGGQGQMPGCLRDSGFKVVGSFPLSVREQLNGWIVVGYSKAQEFTVEQRRFLTTLADQAAVTIENQRLFLRTEKALRDTAVLYHASRAIANASNAADILQAFIEYTAPSNVIQAVLYLVLSEVWGSPFAAIEVGANWGDSPIGDLTGMRYRADDFPFWDELTSPEPVRFDSSTTHSEMQQRTLMAFGIESGVLIPLRAPGRPLGLVLMGSPTDWQSPENEGMIFRALADQASVSLQNMLLFQQAERRARRLGTSAEISRAATSILRMDQLLPQVVQLIKESFGYDHVQVFLLSADGEDARLVASTGDAGQQLLAIQHSLPVGSQSVIGQVTAKGEAQIALDTADAQVIHRPNPYLPNTRSEMALPLIARGQILGALDVQSNQAGAFTEEDSRMLASLADMVATAIDNARLFEVSQQYADEMAFLFNVTAAATASPELDVSLERAVNILRNTMKVTGASIYLIDASGEYLFRGAGVGITSEETELSHIDFDRGLVGWAARHNEAVNIGDISQDPRHLTTHPETLSVMAVPLQAAGVLVGVLVIESDQLNAFDTGDLRLMQTLSTSLGAIIQNTRLLQEVQAANEKLLEVDRLKTNFLAAMSHELRTPLNSIIGFSRVILKGIDGPLTEMQEQDLNTIYDSGKHLLGLVNDILDQAKIEAGKMELSFGYFQLQDVIKGVMSSAVGLTRDKPIKLFTEIADDLPNAYGDEFRTRQVLLNLVSNASKFTDKGSIVVSTFPIVEEDRQFIQVSVADSGIGIAAEDMHVLFEAFQQVDNSTTRRVEGTGMGLPLAKSLTELQGGRIWVESQPGVGSTFSITIPTEPLPELDDTRAPDGAEDKPKTGPLAASEPPPTKMVLVVEDNVEVINLYRRYLARGGYEVIGTTMLEEVEHLIITQRPCMVLLDVNIREGNGWKLLEYLKDADTTFETPVIVCSINTNTEQAFRLGASEFVIKPFTEDQLVDTVRRIEADTARQRILFVDDRPESIRVFREALEKQYTVLEATTGQEALDLLNRLSRVDLVILDLRMPEIDGFAVLQALRADDRTAQIPVLVLTAEDINADERAVLQSIDVYRKDDLDEQYLLDQIASQLAHTRENN
jgi:GAF domain-containing protein/DNA-binding response OmpR family regulator